MDLPPCSEEARNTLLSSLSIGHDISLNFEQIRKFDYVVKTFPSIVADFVNKLTEDATQKNRSVCDPVEALRCQLKPFIMFTHLLGKSPQISGLMYSYFENSSFQPLQVDSFQVEDGQVTYKCPAFDDNLARDILTCLLKYLSFNPNWFGTIWNWSELARYISFHPNPELRYLAACCLSIITKPERYQHIGLLQDAIPDASALMEQQNNYASIFDNTFRPLVETMFERRDEFIEMYGRSETGYSYDSELFAKIMNVLLLKRDSTLEPKQAEKQKQIKDDYILVPSLHDTVSRIAYAASINKPCLIRGSTGVGKTAILDYIAAHTNRLNPPDYVKVQVGDHIDSKSLVGCYVCTDIPGQFEWQPGPLTQAMSYGSWIVFEDIDSAPSEMAQVIHSVIENGNLSCIASCPVKLDHPHPDFKIFFTQRTKSCLQPLKLGFGFVERLCDIIDLPLPTDDELKEMVDQRYQIRTLTTTILKLYANARESLMELDTTTPARQISMRDLFKFCDRIKPRFSASNNETFTPQDFDFLLANAIECFLAHMARENVEKVAEKMGALLNKPAEEVTTFLNRSPELTFVPEQGHFLVGRIKMKFRRNPGEALIWSDSRLSLARTQRTLQLMEALSASICNREPVLLVGETGVGKTTVVQNLAKIMNNDLEVINLSQQSDSSDLLGGYRPVNMREIMTPIHNRFFELFGKTFNQTSNKQFTDHAESLYISAKTTRDWAIYLGVLHNICTKDSIKSLSQEVYNKWESLNCLVRKTMARLSEKDDSPAMALKFSQGKLLKAVREGRWLLLDEVNLAEPDVLQCLLLVLDSLNESHVHMHTGGSERDSVTPFHPDFRVFACMNPSTDIGKRDLPVGVRGRFTEFFVEDVMDSKELRLIVESYVGSCLSRPQIESIVNFYREVRFRSKIYSDISGNSPIFSLRTLCRALIICSQNVCRNTERSLLESLKITFLQQLNVFSVNQVLILIEQTIFKGTTLNKICEAPIQKPSDNHSYVEVEGFWVQTSSQTIRVAEDYILTESVRKNLQRLSRILCLGQRKLPILIQGETSVGKTSLIKYLARLSGNVCYRINNHEHTDLQDYIGRYVLRENGELQFREGLLVTAMRKGYWVILDELNLAPSELLEALNRVLDDNRELYIPETGESVKAHSKFTLFATQNPPQEYAGRKLLSRAFRNRFIELHFDEIPHTELEEILQKRCEMAPQYAKKIVTVMKELQVRRRESGCFGGKNSFMTIRDLFRWGERYMSHKQTIRDGEFYDWNGFVAEEGLILLEGRVRTLTEADVVKSTIEKVFKCNLDRDKIYDYDLPKDLGAVIKFKHIHFTNEFKRLYAQLTRALEYQEPVLLCGQTGCGKTTAAQLYAAQKSQDLITYNCHLNTESSDFIGNVRPSRDSDKASGQKFPWHDGPLLQAMKRGSTFLMDEISLADDAVLERINSVLEPDKSITLTELNGMEIVANNRFRIIATMNPGGDYGKKELSPALRNRFTEIYCHNALNVQQVMAIVEKSLGPGLLKPKIAPNLIRVVRQFLKDYYTGQDLISIRDVLSWISFMNRTVSISVAPLSIQDALLHGACLVYFDQFGTCGHNNLHLNATFELRNELREKLGRKIDAKFGKTPIFNDTLLADRTVSPANQITDYVRFGKFVLRKGPKTISPVDDFIQDAPTVKMNMEKLVRALQLDRPILLEGDPGAGKTSIVAALARLTGHELVRINLSEQTDISDLFGSDLPDIEDTSDHRPRFCWQDGPLLKAIKDSAWILLDEMNLASQSVLEGLNACFDHRGEIYIPELDKAFHVNRNSTRIFACQNPYSQGASRKGLPKSFINRFTSIYVEAHKDQDLTIILSKLYPNVPPSIITNMLDFNNQISSVFSSHGYEFNLRDLIYWCDLMTNYIKHENIPSTRIGEVYEPDRFVQFVYVDRMRSIQDKNDILDLFERVFGYPVYEPPYRDLKFGELSFTMGRAVLPRKTRLPPQLADLCILKYQMPFIESIAKAIEFNNMPILVGEAGVGKRSMVKILAAITGNELDIIGANRDMDTIELLGSFEQKSCHRHMIDLVDDAVKFAMSAINSMPRSQTDLYKHTWLTKYVTSRRDVGLSGKKAMEAYRYQLSVVSDLIRVAHELSPFKNETGYEALKKRLQAIQSRVLYKSESTYSSGNFEWIDSLLIKAIRNGRWLMIENANLLNPATLDRLNSLVEPNGTLCLNEKGSGKDGIEVLKPHPNFRLILTMNPEHGELSRAMRNRGVEIFVRTRFFFEDYLMLLNQNGFVPEQSKACMTYCIMQTSYDAHYHITGEKPEEDGSILAFFGLNYIPNLANQIRRGVNVETILSDLILAFYHRRGHLESGTDESVRRYIVDQLNEYRKKYIVSLNDSRYKWCHFRHDLATLIGGDAIPATVARERKILCEFSDPIATGLLKPSEMLEYFDIVNASTLIKIFMDYSTHVDFEYRRKTVQEAFGFSARIVAVSEANLGAIAEELLPKIRSVIGNDELASSQLVPTKELYVDTRNALDFHFYLQSINYKGMHEVEDLQNRWILALHRMSLLMIVELVDENSHESADSISLYELSDKVRTHEMSKEDLVRPHAEIAYDLHELLFGLLQVVSNRDYPNELVTKMMARTFWISYVLCKLKKASAKRPEGHIELIALCTQLPMLWTLTYQKIVQPLIRDCEIADVLYNSKKFSVRIKHMCEFLDVDLRKPAKEEKVYYKRVVNIFAATTKRTESLSREVEKLFNTIVARYTKRSEQLVFSDSENSNSLVASSLPWSNSSYLTTLYEAHDGLALADSLAKFQIDHSPDTSHKIKEILTEVRARLEEKRAIYDKHEDEIIKSEGYRRKCLTINRRRCALDQFAPVWQTRFVLTRFSRLHPDIESADAKHYQVTLKKLLTHVHGMVMSPRYVNALNRLLDNVVSRDQPVMGGDVADDDGDCPSSSAILKQNIDMYTAFLIDHILENITLDCQLVGWVKMRVYTCDLGTEAPLIPEYSPMVSLVSSYCLDISHLKLNSYLKSSPQLEAMLMYLWRSYSQIKSKNVNEDRDLGLAKNLMHLRQKVDVNNELVGEHKCQDTPKCCCIDKFVSKRLESFEETILLVERRSDCEDVEIFSRAIKLLYYGIYNAKEYLPIFTLDPALRAREKIDVYKAELAHIKSDLYHRNALYYWRTGENLGLTEMSTEEAKLYPMSIRVLVERRDKLERSIKKLRLIFTNRPKSDDGTLYNELKKEVEVAMARASGSISSLMDGFRRYLATKKPLERAERMNQLATKCRMLIKNFERTVGRFRSDYALYSDLTTNYLTGFCLVLQGLRLMYSRLEQKLALTSLGFTHGSTNRFATDLMKVFSFNDSTLTNMESVESKRNLYQLLNVICPTDKLSYMQSLILKASLLQLNHHIVITPSDIEKCIPIVRSIAEKFHKAWLDRKNYLEEQRNKQQELYQYKTSHTSLNDVSYERQEFIDICTKFPLYDHIYQDTKNMAAKTSADRNNLETEAKIINLNRSVDLTMCIDVCKAHYKFMKQASRNLLGQQHSLEPTADFKNIEMSQLIKIEAEVLYSVIRKCISSLDEDFDALSVEYHLLQANELLKVLKMTESNQFQVGSLKSSIEILDEEIFDIYHDGCPQETLKFKDLLGRVEDKINALRNDKEKGLESHPLLFQISKLVDRITSFLMTDPLMKFITGAHLLLSNIEEWNKSMPRDSKMIGEADSLVELIQEWRKIESKSWLSSLHRVKRKYIDDSLCDLWFRLHEAFSDPLKATKQILLERQLADEDEVDKLEISEIFYQGFAFLIKDFLEAATLGDYQIRLDLVFAFTIQTRFAGVHDNSLAVAGDKPDDQRVDSERLTTYVYNIYRQYQGLTALHKNKLEKEEEELLTLLKNEIRIVNWQGRNLWEIKTNFRCSHQKINKVMNRYLEVLRRPIPGVDSEDRKFKSMILPTCLDSAKLSQIFNRVQSSIDDTQVKDCTNYRLSSLEHSAKIVKTLKKLTAEIQPSLKERYVEVLKSVEDALEMNAGSIKTFYDNRVQELTIHPKDSKETRNEKLKTCRQIYHTKKFAMQAIFKTLRDLGMSYQRGLNTSEYLDVSVLSLEPLQGMIQNQTVSVREAASKLVDNQIIKSCNDMYRELIVNNQMLLALPREEDISSEQLERIRGYALDMVLDIVVHNKNAAMIYRHLMDIQAAMTRLSQLQQLDCDEIYVYKFSLVHGSIKRFDRFVSRAIAALAKVEILMECHRTYSALQSSINDGQMANGDSVADDERTILRNLINETDERNSLMTPEQYDYLERHIAGARKSISEISSALRDKLRHTIKSYLYSDDDLLDVQHLYQKFVDTLEQLIPSKHSSWVQLKRGTILGSLKLLREEAIRRLKPILRPEFLTGGLARVDLTEHPNLSKLDARLRRLTKQIKISAQQVYQNHKKYVDNEPVGEAERRKLKPFNHTDSGAIRDLLRPIQVSKQVANCLMTLNAEPRPTNIEPIIAHLTPILFIYSQEITQYLNLILCSLHTKLLTSNQLIPFFIDLVSNGFGLPCKVEELDGSGQEASTGGEAGDNVGFGEGEGETDASKKVEAESQLDELKKEDQKEQNDGAEDQGPETKDIEATDDGVEMSEDFDAKAEGAGDTEPGPEESDGESDADGDERIEELDKKFDDVDEDEDQLEQDLWDDKDEPLGEDDETDLRQTELEASKMPDMDEKELAAMDRELTEAETSAERQDELDEDDQAPEENEEQSASHVDAQMEFEEISDIDPGDLDDTPAEQDETQEKEPEGEDVDIMDMSPISPEIADSSAEINVDDVDEHLENEAEKKPEGADPAKQPDGSLASESDIDIERLDNENQDAGQDSQGVHGDSVQNDPAQDQEGASDDRVSAVNNEAEQSDQTNVVESRGADAQEKDTNKAADEELSGKRTFANRDSFDQNSLKRQKIESARPGAHSQDQNNEAVQETSSLRHVDQATDKEIECIDLIGSSEDDEVLRDDLNCPERNDEKQRSSKPRGSEQVTQDVAREQQGQSTNSSHQQSSYNTNFGLLKFISHGLADKENSTKGLSKLMEQIDEIIKENVDDAEHESITTDRLTSLWLDCTRSTGNLVYELCQQLQIVLQPTKMSKYKGDYKSGKRLNMRKIISYIASHYRKDKIWLRRTKPCKRTYNISLAVDNSSSMSENNCRQMTYQSLALLAKSLSLIEAGSLNVVSFGKQVKTIHEFDQPYVDAIGAQWLRGLRFDESSTSYKSVLRHSCDAFAKQAQVSLSPHQLAGSSVSVNQLLIIISDGRNVTSESDDIKQYLRQLKVMGVLTLFVIIDDPKQNGGRSIVDIKKSVTVPGSRALSLENYMDSFPFPFYVMLRQIETMPTILGDALRQWFELVSGGA